MQSVQTLMRFGAPATTACTFCKLMSQRRFVTLCAWLIRFPNWGPRPQRSHTFDIALISLLVLFLFVSLSYEANRWENGVAAVVIYANGSCLYRRERHCGAVSRSCALTGGAE